MELNNSLAKSAKLRHSVPKGDKKRLKEVKDEITKLENDLKTRHEAELKAAESNHHADPVASHAGHGENDKDSSEKHQTRAQRRRVYDSVHSHLLTNF